ncbi:unnamed protein product [Soboliphyme baturini]|uniref:Nucleoporin NUP53 n=1 Tax=Soboliphyme baturini TaxID=241478 RepID=A0A183J5X6_9BILA|nr:unnamed protein product [Soboliphyme baturini]
MSLQLCCDGVKSQGLWGFLQYKGFLEIKQQENIVIDNMGRMILDLVEILLSLGECAGLYTGVLECLNFPMQQCPDVLTFTLLQVTVPLSTLRQDLLLSLMPIFFGSHVNSLVVLSYAWNSVVCYLSVPQHLFSIDLACLASRRDYLKLDKWMNDKIVENGVGFGFDSGMGKLPMVNSIGSGLINSAVSQQFPNAAFASAPLPSLSPTRHCQPLIGGVPSDGPGLLKAVPPPTGWGAGFAMSGNMNSVSPVIKQGMASQPVVNTPFSDATMPDISQVFCEEVQNEANSYFQQIYTQPPQPSMSIEQFLEILKRFRDSPVKKERVSLL